MADRTQSPAYQMPPRSACRVFAAIERAAVDRLGCARHAIYRNL